MASVPKARAIVLGLAMGAGVLALAHPASADERVECAAAYEHTQRAQQKSELITALEAAERCARPSCPALLTSECSRWVSEVRQKLPALVVRVRASDGCPRDAAKVEVPGAIRKDPDDGTLLVDPGVHEIKVTDPVSSRTKTETIDFAAGERRDIDVDFAPPDAVCGPPKKVVLSPLERIPRPVLIVGAAGGGLVVLGGALGIIGALKRGGLDDCKPNCSNDRLDAVRPFLVAGDVLAGVGLLTIGAAAVTYFVLEHRHEPKSGKSARTRLILGADTLGASF